MADFAKSVVSIFDETIIAVSDLDSDASKRVTDSAVTIDDSGRNLENECIKIISLQRPFASDFRLMTGYLKLASDLGRISAHCLDICEIVCTGKIIRDCPGKDQVVSSLRQVYSMFTNVLDACFNLDSDKAKEVYLSDDSIDESFADIITNVSSSVSDSIISIYSGADLMFIAKYAERIGDRCVSISKWVIYMKEGEFPRSDYFL